MAVSSTDAHDSGYVIDNPVQKKFLQNPDFCLCLQKYVEDLLSIPISIIPQETSENQRNTRKSSNSYTIQLLGTYENRSEQEQIVSDSIKNLFHPMKSTIFNDEKVKEWLHRPTIIADHLTCLQKIMNEKILQVFTVCENDTTTSLKIYYLAREPFSMCRSKEIDTLIHNKILQETILLPIRYEQSGLLTNELETLADDVATKEDVSVSFVYAESGAKRMQKEIVLFGYYKKVNRLKQQYLILIEKHQLLTFKLNALHTFQIDFLCDTYTRKLREIEQEYVEAGVELRLKENEFLAPQYLKDTIESRITQLLSHSTTITFKSIKLSKDIAEQAEKHLKFIARRNRCYIETEFEYKSRCYTIPKAGSSNTQALKSVIVQSNHFRCSSNVFNGIMVKNGSIEIRTGDIALQKVDAIVISSTSNGLQEGVIERAGRFDYEHTYTDGTGAQFTETHGGALHCKKILFSDWVPGTISDDENKLRKSIQVFISQTMEYIIKDKSSTSIAFAVCDSCKNEMILAQEMITVAKQILESNKLPLKIVFVLLPEQETLCNHFLAIRNSMQDIYTQLEWSTAVIKVTLIASQVEYLTKCQEKIENYLKRCTTSSKMVNSNGIFDNWNQHTIDAFYKYCQDTCVLPQIDKTGNKIEFNGSINSILHVKQKLYFLSLYNETILKQSKVPKIMISYCQQDKKMCQRLTNRLIEEDFSVWAKPITGEGHRTVFSQMDKSDCIILCISEHSSESLSCEQEANYAFQTGKLVFPVKIHNHPLIGWQREVFQGKLFLQFFGSENHFDLEFERLLLGMKRFDRQQQNIDEFPNLFTVEERRSKYDAKIRRLMEIGRINNKEMKSLIEQLQNIINDADIETEKERKQEEEENRTFGRRYRKKKANHWKYFNSTEQLAYCAKRWLGKTTNITKQNLPPFSASGDINDVPFPIPEDILNKGDQVFRSLSSPFNAGVSSYLDRNERALARGTPRTIPLDDDYTFGLSTQKTGYDGNLFQVFSETDSADDFIPRKTMSAPRWSVTSARWSTGYSRESITTSKSGKEVQRRPIWNEPNRMQNRHKRNATEPIGNYRSLISEKLEAYKKKFAQRMHENAIEFEKFCSTYTVAE